MTEVVDVVCQLKQLEKAKDDLLKALDSSIQWYAENGKSRGVNSRRIRGLMILLGGVSVLIPLLTQIPSPIGIVISPIWASIAMVFTATLFAFEKYYGYAEAWMRFVLAKQELERLKEEFVFSWLELSLMEDTVVNLEKALAELIRVSVARHDIVRKETEAWIEVFKGGLNSTNPNQDGMKPNV